MLKHRWKIVSALLAASCLLLLSLLATKSDENTQNSPEDIWQKVQQEEAEREKPENTSAALLPWVEYLPQFDYEYFAGQPGHVKIFNRKMRGPIAYQIMLFPTDGDLAISSISMHATVVEGEEVTDLGLPWNHFRLILEKLLPDCESLLTDEIKAGNTLDFPSEGRKLVSGETASGWFVKAESFYGPRRSGSVISINLTNGTL